MDEREVLAHEADEGDVIQLFRSFLVEACEKEVDLNAPEQCEVARALSLHRGYCQTLVHLDSDARGVDGECVGKLEETSLGSLYHYFREDMDKTCPILN